MSWVRIWRLAGCWLLRAKLLPHTAHLGGRARPDSLQELVRAGSRRKVLPIQAIVAGRAPHARERPLAVVEARGRGAVHACMLVVSVELVEQLAQPRRQWREVVSAAL